MLQSEICIFWGVHIHLSLWTNKYISFYSDDILESFLKEREIDSYGSNTNVISAE